MKKFILSLLHACNRAMSKNLKSFDKFAELEDCTVYSAITSRDVKIEQILKEITRTGYGMIDQLLEKNIKNSILKILSRTIYSDRYIFLDESYIKNPSQEKCPCYVMEKREVKEFYLDTPGGEVPRGIRIFFIDPNEPETDSERRLRKEINKFCAPDHYEDKPELHGL